MIQVSIPEDCGNAPRKLLLKDLAIAQAQGDWEPILEQVSDDVVWELVGQARIQGREAMRRALAEADPGEIEELRIHTIITHGATAALNATLTMQDGWRLASCDVYHFSGAGKRAAIKTITSYRIETREPKAGGDERSRTQSRRQAGLP